MYEFSFDSQDLQCVSKDLEVLMWSRNLFTCCFSEWVSEWVSVCVCVWVYVCECVCVSLCVSGRVCECVCVSVCVWVSVCVSLCVWVSEWVCECCVILFKGVRQKIMFMTALIIRLYNVLYNTASQNDYTWQFSVPILFQSREVPERPPVHGTWSTPLKWVIILLCAGQLQRKSGRASSCQVTHVFTGIQNRWIWRIWY